MLLVSVLCISHLINEGEMCVCVCVGVLVNQCLVNMTTDCSPCEGVAIMNGQIGASKGALLVFIRSHLGIYIGFLVVAGLVQGLDAQICSPAS